MILLRRLANNARWVPSWFKALILQSYERAGWRRLRMTGGVNAVSALKDGLAAGEAYRQWDSWSLSPIALLWTAELVMRRKIRTLYEFGSGNSTVALAVFLSKAAPQARLVTFEHQADYAQRLHPHISNLANVQLHFAPLRECDDDIVPTIFTAADAAAQFARVSRPVPEARQSDTLIRNAFYGFDFATIAPNSAECVLLDGPNGNGRAIAVPILRRIMKCPGWILIDDYMDYTILEDLHRHFASQTIRQATLGRKEFALFRLGACPSNRFGASNSGFRGRF